MLQKHEELELKFTHYTDMYHLTDRKWYLYRANRVAKKILKLEFKMLNK